MTDVHELQAGLSKQPWRAASQSSQHALTDLNQASLDPWSAASQSQQQVWTDPTQGRRGSWNHAGPSSQHHLSSSDKPLSRHIHGTPAAAAASAAMSDHASKADQHQLTASKESDVLLVAGELEAQTSRRGCQAAKFVPVYAHGNDRKDCSSRAQPEVVPDSSPQLPAVAATVDAAAGTLDHHNNDVSAEATLFDSVDLTDSPIADGPKQQGRQDAEDTHDKQQEGQDEEDALDEFFSNAEGPSGEPDCSEIARQVVDLLSPVKLEAEKRSGDTLAADCAAKRMRLSSQVYL